MFGPTRTDLSYWAIEEGIKHDKSHKLCLITLILMIWDMRLVDAIKIQLKRYISSTMLTGTSIPINLASMNCSQLLDVAESMIKDENDEDNEWYQNHQNQFDVSGWLSYYGYDGDIAKHYDQYHHLLTANLGEAII